MVALDSYTPDTTILGAKLYTKQYVCDLVGDPTCQADPEPANSLDLNANPDRITFVGRVSLVFKPCPTKVTYTGSDRLRGDLVATVPAEWLADDGVDAAGQKKYRRVSSVFMAAQTGNCDSPQPEPPPGALEFWDTAHVELKAIGHSLPSCPSPAGRSANPQVPVS